MRQHTPQSNEPEAIVVARTRVKSKDLHLGCLGNLLNQSLHLSATRWCTSTLASTVDLDKDAPWFAAVKSFMPALECRNLERVVDHDTNGALVARLLLRGVQVLNYAFSYGERVQDLRC